ncbi:MAG: cyclic pyranopterin monophosphate synthase MoaC [Thermoplasmatota archaeon]
MRLRDTSQSVPVRRMTVAEGFLEAPGHTCGEEEVAAARAAALAAAKDASRLLPTASPFQLTDAFCSVETEGPRVKVTVTLQGVARETLESAALVAVSTALVALRDALGASGAGARIVGVAVVQSVAH